MLAWQSFMRLRFDKLRRTKMVAIGAIIRNRHRNRYRDRFLDASNFDCDPDPDPDTLGFKAIFEAASLSRTR
jgi:hypothetical protein